MKQNYLFLHKIGLFRAVIVLFCLLTLVLAGSGFAGADYYERDNSWTYTLAHRIAITNTSNRIAEDILINVLLMDTRLPIYQEVLAEQFSPWPTQILTDKNGQRQAVYKIPRLEAGQTVYLEQRYAVNSYAVHYDIKLEKLPHTYEKGEVDARYLAPEEGVESANEQIIAFAKKAAEGETNPYLIAQKAWAAVNLYMTYSSQEGSYRGALYALQNARGSCSEYTNLFVAVLRALGIPARQQNGYLYLPRQHTRINPESGGLDLSMLRHAWPEFYLPDTGWVLADPTYTYMAEFGGVKEKFLDMEYFANIPSAHRYIFFRAGDGREKEGFINYYPSNQLKADTSLDLYFENACQPFNDLEGHWAKDNIIYLFQGAPGLIQGRGNGVFAPNDSISRAEVAVFLQRLEKTPLASTAPFSDVPGGYWAAGEIGAAAAAGWLRGYPDGTFLPGRGMSRGEIAAVLVRLFQLEAEDAAEVFQDLDEPGYTWAKNDILTLAALGYSNGLGNGLFAPQKNVTRAEFLTFLTNIIKDQGWPNSSTPLLGE